jgi:putative hydrolases of HD superfamily
MSSEKVAEQSIYAVVQRQLDAYNARDIDAFMPCWTDDCQCYEFPDRLLVAGHAQLRQRHVERFQDVALHGKLIQRMTLDDLVVDREIVTRTFPQGQGEIDVIAMYQLQDGKISKAWFRFGQPRWQA